MEFRAGAVSWVVGQAGVTVPLSPPVTRPYTVVVQPTHAAGYSPTSEATYFNIVADEPAMFAVQHKTIKDGTPIPVDTGITLKWILMTH